MPIYEYACSDCDHKLEIIQKMNDPRLEQCPACGKNTLKKLISPSAFRLKGTGWYETDFSGKKKPQEKAEATKTDTTKAEATKTDTAKTGTTDKTPAPTTKTSSTTDK